MLVFLSTGSVGVHDFLMEVVPYLDPQVFYGSLYDSILFTNKK